MGTVASYLKNHYRAVIQSSSEPLFYKNVHAYLNFVLKNPDLALIMDESEKEYLIKHKEIWGDKKSTTNRQLEEKEEQTHRLEQFSLYAKDFAFLYTRIYAFIEEYKNHTEPDERPYLQAIIMLRGIDRIKSTLWHKEDLEQYSRWYTGKRKEYESRLRQFHADLLTRIEKPKDYKKETPVKSNLPLSFNTRTGDFVFYKTKGNLSLGGQEFKVFSTLYNSPDFQADYLKLIQSYNPTVEVAHKAYRDDLFVIIRNIKERLNILPTTKTSNPDIFKNNKKIGYRLVFSSIDKNTE